MSATSGLIRVGQRLFVVADDECGLGVFDLSGDAPERLFDWVATPLSGGLLRAAVAPPQSA